jgi:hypothetical protein
MTSVTEIQLGSIFEDPILVQLDDLSRHGQISTSCTRQIVGDNFSLSDHDLSVDDTKTKFKTVDLTYIENDLDEFHKDALVQQALNKGVDLKKYYIDLEKDLKDAETDCVAQYVENSDKVNGLHKNIQDCDGLLSKMEDMLLAFQRDLGDISEEIKHLQNNSNSMSIRLKNLKAVENKLKFFIDNSCLSPEDADAITGKVIPSFLHSSHIIFVVITILTPLCMYTIYYRQ